MTRYRDHRVFAVVPAFNEEQLVGTVIETMPEFITGIVVVDDASTDATADVIRSSGDPRVELIVHESNLGVGGAVVTGYRRALDSGADITVVMAGDAQMDPAYLPDLLDPIVDGRADMAKANRFFGAGSFASMPRHRIFGNVVLSFLNKMASGYWHIFDPQNGYVATRREALEAINLDTIARGYSLENDVLIAMNIVGARVVDIPVPARYASERSGIRLRHVIPEMFSLLGRGFWRRILLKYVLWSFSPVALFLFSGLLLCAFGSVVAIWTVAHTLGPRVATTGTVLLAVGPLLVGIQLLIFATVLDIQEAQRLEVHLDPFGGHSSRERARRRLDDDRRGDTT